MINYKELGPELIKANKEHKAGLREDLAFRRVAAIMGWTEILSDSDAKHERIELPHEGLSFQKDNIHIWCLGNGVWQCAYIVKNRYTGHHSYDSLFGAFDEETLDLI